MESKFLTVKEAASYLHCGTTKLYLAVNSGKIPATKFGKTWLIGKEALDKQLEKHSNAPKIRRTA